MDEIDEAVGEPLHPIGEPLAFVKDVYEKQPAEADLETVPASRNSMERKGEPEIDLVGPVYSNRTGIIARERETALLMNDTAPELRPADAGKPGMLEVRKLVETGLGAPVASMHSIDLPSPFHFTFMSGHSLSALGRAQQRGQLCAALFLLLVACGGLLSEWMWPPGFGAAS